MAFVSSLTGPLWQVGKAILDTGAHCDMRKRISLELPSVGFYFQRVMIRLIESIKYRVTSFIPIEANEATTLVVNKTQVRMKHLRTGQSISVSHNLEDRLCSP